MYMSDLTYDPMDSSRDKPLVWLGKGIQSPPFSTLGKVEAGYRLRRLQQGELLFMPHSRPMPVIGPRCRELRIHDVDHSWRLIYRLDPDAIVIAEVFDKSSRKTPREIIELCRKRLWAYDQRGRRGQRGRQ